MKEIWDPDRPWYREIRLKSLYDFNIWRLNHINVMSYDPLDGMIFRGVAKADTYSLIPSAFRKSKSNTCYEIEKIFLNDAVNDPSHDKQKTLRDMIHTEISELHLFFKEANINGLAVPDVKYFIEHMFTEYHHPFLEQLNIWPDPSMLEIMAMAQHYGLPTRLLDWTYSFNISLYFALKGLIEELYIENIEKKTASNAKKAEKEPFAIWAIKLTNIQGIYEASGAADCPIKFYVPIYANNPNLRAQKGILSYQRSRISNDEINTPFNIIPLDELLHEFYQNAYTNGIEIIMDDGKIETVYIEDNYEFCKFVFDITDPIAEFEKLSKQGINAASLFPGYDGVVKKIIEDKMIQQLKTAK